MRALVHLPMPPLCDQSGALDVVAARGRFFARVVRGEAPLVRWLGRPMLVADILFALLALLPSVACAETDYHYLEHTPPLLERLTPDVMAMVYPHAGRLQLVEGKGAPVVAVYDGDAVAGY